MWKEHDEIRNFQVTSCSFYVGKFIMRKSNFWGGKEECIKREKQEYLQL